MIIKSLKCTNFSYFLFRNSVFCVLKHPTAGNVIPVIDSLENAVSGIERSNAAINPYVSAY